MVYRVQSEHGGDLEYEHLYGGVERRVHAARDTAERAAQLTQDAYEGEGWDRTAWVEQVTVDDLLEHEREYAEEMGWI